MRVRTLWGYAATFVLGLAMAVTAWFLPLDSTTVLPFRSYLGWASAGVLTFAAYLGVQWRRQRDALRASQRSGGAEAW